MEVPENPECDSPLCDCVGLRLFELRENFRIQWEAQRRAGALVNKSKDPGLHPSTLLKSLD